MKFPGGRAPTGPEQPPTAPSNLRTDIVTATRVALRWTDNAGDESGYRIERCQGSSTCTSFVTLTDLPANTVTHMDTSVAKHTSYRYRVRAINAAGASAASNVVSVKTAKK